MTLSQIASGTNKAIVIEVSPFGCLVAVNGHNVWVKWNLLNDAADQDDYVRAACRGLDVDDTTRELARFYRGIRDQAQRMVEGNRELPLKCRVHQDGTDVCWVASFWDVMGYGSWIPRDADEGGHART